MKNQKSRIEKLTASVYGDLSPAERLRLVLLHLADENHEEAIRLIDACPLKTYRMMDPVYTNKFRAAHGLAARAAHGLIAKYMLVLQLVLWYETKCGLYCLLYPSEEAGEGEVKTAPDLPPPSVECAKAMKRILDAEATMSKRGTPVGEGYFAVLALMKAEWAGFDACCLENLGINGKTLLRAFLSPFFYEWFEAIEPTLESVEQPKDYEELVEACRKRYDNVIALLVPCKGD